MEVDTLAVATDRRCYIEQLMKVQTKERTALPFLLNRPQQIIWDAIGPGARIAELKARQIGSTTVYIARFLAECMSIPGTVSVIASENDFMTQRALARAHYLYRSIPAQYKPEMAHKSASEMTWPTLDSVMYIATARSNLLVRGDTVHNFLGTEIARWPDPEGAMSAVEEAVPLSCFIALESTPRGEGDYFHEKIKAAMDRRSSYKFVFLPWWLADDYTLPTGSPLAIEGDRGRLEYTPEEQNLVELHGLSEGQIRWRRRKVSDRGLDFPQEYPEDPVTCFLSSGEMLFDARRLDELAKGCCPAPTSLDNVMIWHQPVPGGLYLVAVDPTVGIHDRAAATVWLVGETLTHCATLWGLYDPVVLAGKLHTLCHYYNTAKLQIEFNGPGQAVLAEMRSYPNLGYRIDLLTGAPTGSVGWLTTKASKAHMIAQMRKHIGTLVVRDLNIIRQLRGARLERGDMVWIGEDDLAMSAMIATATYQGIMQSGLGLVGTYGWGDNW